MSYAKAIDLWYGGRCLAPKGVPDSFSLYVVCLPRSPGICYCKQLHAEIGKVRADGQEVADWHHQETWDSSEKGCQRVILGTEGDHEKAQVETITANGGVNEKKAAFRYIDETNRTTLPAAKTFMCELCDQKVVKEGSLAVKHATPPRLNKFPDKIKYEELTPEGFVCSETEEKGKYFPNF